MMVEMWVKEDPSMGRPSKPPVVRKPVCVECKQTIVTGTVHAVPKLRSYICESCYRKKQDLVQRAIAFWQSSSTIVRWIAIPAAVIIVIMVLKTIAG